VRACYKAAGKERRRSRVELRVPPDPGTVRTPDTSARVAEREWVLSELGRLDIDRRTVLVLHYYLDLSLPEVAEILDIPYGTVTSRLHRGLEQMRRSMRVSPALTSDPSVEQAP